MSDHSNGRVTIATDEWRETKKHVIDENKLKVCESETKDERVQIKVTLYMHMYMFNCLVMKSKSTSFCYEWLL